MTDTPPPEPEVVETPKQAKKRRTRLQLTMLVLGCVLGGLVVLIAAALFGGRLYIVSDAGRELVAAVRTVANGDPYLQAGAARALAKEFKKREQGAAERSKYEELSNREKEILKLVASGYSAPEIGGQLHISPKTVDTYKQRINEKLGLHHRSDYVKFALKLKLLES